MAKDTQSSGISGKKQLFWNLAFILIAAASVWLVTSQAKGFSPAKFSEYLTNNNPWYLGIAMALMLSYILFAALAILCILKGFGYKRSLADGISYAATDLYFSTITPSATGGQPVEGYIMVRDGLPTVITTVSLLTNMLLYTVSIVLIGFTCLLIKPSSFMRFSTFSRILIIIGAVIQVGLVFLYAILLWNKTLLQRICDWILRVLGKLHLIRNLEKKREKLRNVMDSYSRAARMLKGKRRTLVKGLALNIAHRACQILVIVFCYLAGGGSWRHVPDIFAIRSNVVMGACCIPIPGSMGVTDYMMLDGYCQFLMDTKGITQVQAEAQAANLELLSRTMSFYVCILLCGLIVLTKYIIIRFRRDRK
jgi:uncharacterized protein (TIRG00374 family)